MYFFLIVLKPKGLCPKRKSAVIFSKYLQKKRRGSLKKTTSPFFLPSNLLGRIYSSRHNDSRRKLKVKVSHTFPPFFLEGRSGKVLVFDIIRFVMRFHSPFTKKSIGVFFLCVCGRGFFQKRKRSGDTTRP